MTIQLKLIRRDKSEQEFEFNRPRVKVGRGPLNDLRVDDPDVLRHVGDIEVHDQGARFVCHEQDGICSHVRGDESQTSYQSAVWDLQPGDVVHLGETILIFSQVRQSSTGGIDWLHLPSIANSQSPEAGFACMVRDVSKQGTEGCLLRAACGLLHRHTKLRPKNVSLMRVADGAEYRRHTLVLVPTDDDAPQEWLSSGNVTRTVDPVRRLGAAGIELLEGLKGGKVGLYRMENEVELFVPLQRQGETFAVLGFDMVGATSHEIQEAAIVAQEIAPLASMVLKSVELQKSYASIMEENRYFRERERRHYLFKELIAESKAMRSTYRTLNEFVDNEHPVLIVGCAGSGKELLARAVHHLSVRKDAMMISLNCGKLSGVDIDLELFGSIAGGVTGAAAPRKGVFELAGHGTVYLEEIDLLSPLVQGKLLRMINENELRRVGDSVGRKVTSRLVCSVHRDLDELVEAGSIRRDLYFALKDHILPVPTLHERTEDIMPLSRIFMGKFAARYGRKVHRIHPEVEARLKSYSWPGNARELQARMEAAVLQCHGEVLLSGHLRLADD